MNRLFAARPIETEGEYQAMLEFLRELMRTKSVEREPFKSLWATATLYAADWEALFDPQLITRYCNAPKVN